MAKGRFRRRLCVVVAGVAVWVAWPAGAGGAAPAQVERTVLVTVLDKDNVPIRDLTAKDFLVYEDGVLREVTAATLATSPLSVSVLLDTTKSPLGTPEPTRDIRTSLLTFVKILQAADPKTQVALTEFAGAGVILRSFTDKPEDLARAINRIVPNQRSNAVLLETLVDAARDIRKRPGPRRAIVTVDRGSLESSRLPPQRVIDEVMKSGAAVWSVSLTGEAGVTAPARDVVLDVLTEGTGGLRVNALLPSALEMLLKTVADALTAQYIVTYSRPEGPPPQSLVPAATRGAKFLRAPWVD